MLRIENPVILAAFLSRIDSQLFQQAYVQCWQFPSIYILFQFIFNPEKQDRLLDYLADEKDIKHDWEYDSNKI